jgi:predicted nucleotidyltransferase
MDSHVPHLREAEDSTYFQDTFYFTALISMAKDVGGSRDETKNDIRALPEILTVTLVEPEKGGVQRDLGSKYLSTYKIHVRRPQGIDKYELMKRVVLKISNLRGISVLRYKERKPKPRKKAFHGPGSYKITEIDYQKVRHEKSAEYAKEKAQYLSTGPQKTGGAPFNRPASKKRGKSAPPIVGSTGGAFGLEETNLEDLYEDVLITIRKDHEDLLAFGVQPGLNEKIWANDDEIRPGVKGALMDIVDEFVEGLDMDVDIKDVIVTGSLANYNWSRFSDIDVHILIDFSEVNDHEAMVKKFFDAVRSNWNRLHNILVKGHEVEIYVQDEHEPHVSTGVYSLKEDRWLLKPKKVKPELDRATATKKMVYLAREIDKLSALYDAAQYPAAFELAERTRAKIKKMRHTGLDRDGIYAPENLAFKMLRRSGDIEQLFSIYTQAYDRLYSVDQ